MGNINDVEQKEIDAVIQQIASDTSLYGLDPENVKSLWMEVLLEQIANNDKQRSAH